MSLEIRPVRGIGDVVAGDDLAALITTAAPWLAVFPGLALLLAAIAASLLGRALQARTV